MFQGAANMTSGDAFLPRHDLLGRGGHRHRCHTEFCRDLAGWGIEDDDGLRICQHLTCPLIVSTVTDSPVPFAESLPFPQPLSSSADALIMEAAPTTAVRPMLGLICPRRSSSASPPRSSEPR